jgi:putative addiction module killer protein
MDQIIEVRRYVSPVGKDVVGEWLKDLGDVRAWARINARIARLAVGNFGDCRFLREGVSELRVDYGPGYRVYFARPGRTVVLLLCGGDKRRQAADIDRAIALWNDYQRRTP